MRQLGDQDKRRLEREIALGIGRGAKVAYGKGPVKTKVTITDEYILIVNEGHCRSSEVELARLNGEQLRSAKRTAISPYLEFIASKIEELTAFKINQVFYDINVEDNISIFLMLYDAKANQKVG